MLAWVQTLSTFLRSKFNTEYVFLQHWKFDSFYNVLYYYFKISIWAWRLGCKSLQSGGDRAVARSMQKTSVMLLQTTDSNEDDSLLGSLAFDPRSPEHISLTSDCRESSRLWLHRLPITLRRQARNPPSIMTLNQMTRPVQSVVPAYYHWKFLSCATNVEVPQTSPSAPIYRAASTLHVNLRKSCMFVLLNVVGVTIESMDTENSAPRRLPRLSRRLLLIFGQPELSSTVHPLHSRACLSRRPFMPTT
jgi:hypothetical protein